MAESAPPARRPEPDVPPPPPGVWPLAGAHPGPGGPPSIASADPAAGPVVSLPVAVTAIAVYFLAQVLLPLAAALLLVAPGFLDPGQFDPSTGGVSLLTLVVASQVAGLVGVLLLLRRQGLTLAGISGPRRPSLRHLGTGVGVGLVGFVGSSVVVSLLVRASGSTAAPDQLLTRSVGDSPLPLLLAVLAAVVLAPLAEELLFRGLLHRALRRRLRVAPATLVSSVAFAVVHVEVIASQPLALIGLALLGAVLAIAHERSGRLLVPVVAHATYNGVAILLTVVTSRVGDVLLPLVSGSAMVVG